MLRLFGVCAVSLSVLLYGAFSYSLVLKKISCEDAFIGLLEHIKSMIRAGNMPLDRIFQNYSNTALEKTGFLEAVRKNGSMKFYGTLDAFSKKLCIDTQEKEILCNFFREIGTCTGTLCGEQLCERYIVLFKSHVNDGREKEKSRAELYKKMSFVVAAAVFIVFV